MRADVDVGLDWSPAMVKATVGEADDYYRAIARNCVCHKPMPGFCHELGPHSLMNETTLKKMLSVRRDPRFQRGEWSR